MGRLARRSILLALAVAGISTTAVAQGWQHLGKVQHLEKLSDGVELTTGAAKVRITSFRRASFVSDWPRRGPSRRTIPGPSSNLQNRALSPSLRKRLKSA